MKWTIEREPRAGDERTVRRFARLPVWLSDGVTVVWWEHYYARQVYTLMKTGYIWLTHEIYSATYPGEALEKGEV